MQLDLRNLNRDRGFSLSVSLGTNAVSRHTNLETGQSQANPQHHPLAPIGSVSFHHGLRTGIYMGWCGTNITSDPNDVDKDGLETLVTFNQLTQLMA